VSYHENKQKEYSLTENLSMEMVWRWILNFIQLWCMQRKVLGVKNFQVMVQIVSYAG
jgi:hypothetical protein